MNGFEWVPPTQARPQGASKRIVAERQPNYADRAVALLQAESPGLEPDLLRLYALLVLTRGTQTTLADVHDAYVLWWPSSSGDRCLVPFAELPPHVQELDRPYMVAIHRVAEQLGSEEGRS